MTKEFDMGVFLAGVLTGSRSTQKRHFRQAKLIQAVIADRWHRKTPWEWQEKHLLWFFEYYLAEHSSATKYYYYLTAQALCRRLENSWRIHIKNKKYIQKITD